MKIRTLTIAAVAPFFVTAAHAAPGLGDKVYGARLEKGVTEIEAGYLFALGSARDETDGKFRLVLEYEFRF